MRSPFSEPAETIRFINSAVRVPRKSKPVERKRAYQGARTCAPSEAAPLFSSKTAKPLPFAPCGKGKMKLLPNISEATEAWAYLIKTLPFVFRGNQSLSSASELTKAHARAPPAKRPLFSPQKQQSLCRSRLTVKKAIVSLQRCTKCLTFICMLR